jgi:hypothetical protein
VHAQERRRPAFEALNRHFSHCEPAITVPNVSVNDGGNAIVDNVTQQGNVIVSDKRPAARKTPKTARAGRGQDCGNARGDAQP